MRLATLLTIAIAVAPVVAAAKTERNPSVPRQFQRENPCPSTGQSRGVCPGGWVRDHTVPLACGGADAPENMRWMRVEDARIKDREALRACRSQRP